MTFSRTSCRVFFWVAVAICLLPCLGCYKRAATMMRSAGPSEGYYYTNDEAPEGRQLVKSKAELQSISAQLASTTVPRKIIRNGSLELVVVNVDDASNKIRAIVEGLGGFVEKSAQTNVGGRTATITVRVPADSLDGAIAKVKSLATSVDRETVEARDVTRDYIDLDARLRNARAEEERYLEILKRATTIKDTLDGAEKLSNVRGRIEQLQGEMNYLTSQINMSSLAISLQADAGSSVLGVRWRPLRQAKIAASEMISGFADWADAVIAFFINLPLILVWTASVIALAFVAVRVFVFSWKKLGPKTTWRLPWSRARSEARSD